MPLPPGQEIIYSSSINQDSSFSRTVLVSQETWRQGCQLQETMYSLGKQAVRQMEIPIQPASSILVSIPASVSEEVCCSSLLFLKDILSDRDFLVDSEASVSVFPGPASTSSNKVSLLTADGTLIHCSGTRIIPLRFSCGSKSKVYSWNFHLAPVSVPILGADFLHHFDLLVDVQGCRLVRAAPCSSPRLSVSRSCSLSSQTCSPPTNSLPPSHIMVSTH